MTRRIAMVLAVLLLPGGFVFLFAAMLVKAITRSDAGRKVWGRVAGLCRRPATPPPVRQAA